MNQNIHIKNQRHGYWSQDLSNGTPWYKCFYNNGELIGYEEYHYITGSLSRKQYHII